MNSMRIQHYSEGVESFFKKYGLYSYIQILPNRSGVHTLLGKEFERFHTVSDRWFKYAPDEAEEKIEAIRQKIRGYSYHDFCHDCTILFMDRTWDAAYGAMDGFSVSQSQEKVIEEKSAQCILNSILHKKCFELSSLEFVAKYQADKILLDVLHELFGFDNRQIAEEAVRPTVDYLSSIGDISAFFEL